MPLPPAMFHSAVYTSASGVNASISFASPASTPRFVGLPFASMSYLSASKAIVISLVSHARTSVMT